MAEKETKKPIMDVEKPGATPASATSRPIIISKGPAIKDPMVNQDKTETEETPTVQLPTKKKTIQPLSVQSKDEPSETTPAPEAPESTETKSTEQEVSEELAPDLVPDEQNNKTDQPGPDTEISEEERKRQELIDKLVAEKKYFVPIGAAQKKRTARNTALLFMVFLLVVGGVVLAIDAELVQTNITLPFDLIK